MDLPYTNIPADGPQIPSGEYQMLPEPPGAMPQQDDVPEPGSILDGVDEQMALRWALQYMMPDLFGNEQQG